MSKISLINKNSIDTNYFWVPFLITSAHILTLISFRENLSTWYRHKIPLSGDGLLIFHLLNISTKSSWLDILKQNVTSENFGWPNALHLSAYPMGNTLDFLIFKMFSQLNIFGDNQELFHAFVLMKFPIISICAFFFFRVMKNSLFISYITALVFTFIPFNLIRSEGHFVLGSTWTIPLGLFLLFQNLNPIYGNQFRAIKEESKALNILRLTGFFICGFNNLYFAIFLFIIAFGVICVLTINARLISQISNKLSFVKASLVTLLPLASGIFAQLIPMLISRNSLDFISNITKRSPVEAIIYSGNLNSLFFDFHAKVLGLIGRYDLVEFLRSQTHWEGTQFGPTIGFILYILIIVSILKFIWVKRNNFAKPTNFEFTFQLWSLFFAFLIYLSSPINFGFTALFGSIRAWGRAAPIVAILVLGLLLEMRKTIKLKYVSNAIVLLLICSIWIQVSDFRNARPTAFELNLQTTSELAAEQTRVTNLNIKPNCSIVSLPFYPFPEFDVPDDKISDYEYLKPTLFFGNNVSWSSGAVKGTYDAYWLQNLQSEFPPFERADLKAQISYAMHSDPCLILINRNQLTDDEIILLSIMSKNDLIQSSCIYSETVSSPFIYLVNAKEGCFQSINYVFGLNNKNISKKVYDEWTNSPLMYKNLSVGIEKISDYLMWTSSESERQNLELGFRKGFVRTPVFVHVFVSKENSNGAKYEVCLEVDKSQESRVCKSTYIEGSALTNIVTFKLNKPDVSKTRKIDLSISTIEHAKSYWAVLPSIHKDLGNDIRKSLNNLPLNS